MNKVRQQGFSLVTTIFILVVLGLLGTYMAAMSTVQNQSTALSVLGVRTWYAALSGLDWAAYNINSPGGSCISKTLNFDGFNVEVDCNLPAYSITEAGETYELYDIEVTAQWGDIGDSDYVTRTVRATLGGP